MIFYENVPENPKKNSRKPKKTARKPKKITKNSNIFGKIPIPKHKCNYTNEQEVAAMRGDGGR